MSVTSKICFRIKREVQSRFARKRAKPAITIKLIWNQNSRIHTFLSEYMEA